MPLLASLEVKYFPAIPVAIPHFQDTEVTPLVDGREYFGSLESAIAATRGAGDIVYLVNWLFDQSMELTDSSLTDLGNLLAMKAANGVDVRIIIWTGRLLLGKRTTGMEDPAWWANAIPYALAHYKTVVDFNIRNALALRTLVTPLRATPALEGRVLMDWSGGMFGSRHQKYSIVYNSTTRDLRAYVGSLDFSQKAIASPDHTPDEIWHNVGVQLRGGAATAVWDDFKLRWEEAGSLPAKQFMLGGSAEYFNPTTPASLAVPPIVESTTLPIATVTSSASVRVVRSYAEYQESLIGSQIPWHNTPPAGGGLTEILEVFTQALSAATTYIYIEDQGLNTNEILTAHRLLWGLVRDATLRGVKVIFVVPGHPSDLDPAILNNESWSDSLDSSLMPFASHFAMYRVNGVNVHSKLVLIDDEFACVGSANFFDRSMDGTDTELNAAVVDTGPLVADIRVRLWAEHLGVDATDPAIRSELADHTKSLAIFKAAWGSGVAFAYPDSRLHEVPH